MAVTHRSSTRGRPACTRGPRCPPPVHIQITRFRLFLRTRVLVDDGHMVRFRSPRDREPTVRPDRPVRVIGAARRHGAAEGADRRELETRGWRTTLDYTENLQRSRDGRLQHLQVEWRATAERHDGHGQTTILSARSSSVERVWSRLLTEADLAAIPGGTALGAAPGHLTGPSTGPADPGERARVLRAG